MKLKFLLFLLVPVVTFASEAAAEGGSDFWWRLLNFTIFAIIIYRLVGDKIAAFFKGRSQKIASDFSSIEQKLKEAKLKKQEAKAKLEESSHKADELLKLAKDEAQLISKKIEEDVKLEKETLQKSLEERVEVETKKMKEEVVKNVLDELFDSKDVQISNEELLKIIKKKVA